MNNFDHNVQQEKKLDRRAWLGWVLMIVLIVVYMWVSMGIITLLAPWLASLGPRDRPTFWLIAAGLILVLLILTGVTVFVFFRALRWTTEWQRGNFERGTAVLQNTLPQAVSEQEVKAVRSIFSGRSFVFNLLLLVGAFLIIGMARFLVNALVPRLWPAAPPAATEIAYWIVLVVLFLCIPWIVSRQRIKRAGEERGTPKDVLLRLPGTLFYLAFTFLPLLGLLPLARLVSSVWIFPLLLVLFTLGYGALNMIYLLVPFIWALAPIRRGDYDGTVRRAALLVRVHVFRGAFLNLHGYALLSAGRYEEARDLLQTGIRATRSELAAGGADGLDNIGCILMAQGQTGEAVKMFEGAITINPRHIDSYNNLAQLLLSSDQDPNRALELADRALKNYQSTTMAKLLERYQLGSILSTRAWALVKLGRIEEANQASERALALADRGFVPEYAALLYRLGYVDTLLGRSDRAVLRWREAARLDPNGPSGRRAAEALENM